MSKADKIADRLPHFYMHWEKGTVVSSVVEASGKNLDEAEKDFVSIMRAHWVDTADHEDLDRIGKIYSFRRKAGEKDDDFRGRLKSAVMSYKGGGTLNAVRMMVRISMGRPEDFPVTIIENPPVKLVKNWKVRANTDWTVNPRNIRDADPVITISVETPGAKITDPTITNLETGSTVMFKGDMVKGDTLVLAGSRAALNGKEVSDRLEGSVPVMPRKKTKWRYTELIGANLGTFDSALFDKAVFAVDIMSSITFEWTAYQPATFDVIIQKEEFSKSKVTESYVKDLLDMAKGSGIKANLKIVEQQPAALAPEPPSEEPWKAIAAAAAPETKQDATAASVKGKGKAKT